MVKLVIASMSLEIHDEIKVLLPAKLHIISGFSIPNNIPKLTVSRYIVTKYPAPCANSRFGEMLPPVAYPYGCFC